MKYLSAVLALVVVSSLILTPTSRAVAAPAVLDESATCGAISLDIHKGPGTSDAYFFNITNTHGQSWVMYRGLTQCGGCMYKGCPFVPTPTWVYGPYTGDVSIIVHAQPGDFTGYWQVVSADATSNSDFVQ